MDCFGFYDSCFINFNNIWLGMKKLILALLFLPTLTFSQKEWVHVGKSGDGSDIYKYEKIKPTEESLLKGKTFVGYGIITIDFVERKYKIYSWATKTGTKCGYVSIRDKATKTQEKGTLYLKTCKCPN